MPELPEVEVCRLNIIQWLRDDPVLSLELHDKELLQKGAPSEFQTHMVNAGERGWRRQGKVLLWDHLNAGTLAIQLRMTGRMSRISPESALPPHTRAVFHLRSEARMAFIDMRRLGKWWWGDREAVQKWSGCSRQGPDALIEPLDGDTLLSRMGQSKRPLKTALLDQRVIAGIGNIAASEICFRARVDPRTSTSSLEGEHGHRLSAAIRAYLLESIERDRGTEILYQGEPGATNPFALYKRENEPCPRCANPIRRHVINGRSTFWCEICQEKPQHPMSGK